MDEFSNYLIKMVQLNNHSLILKNFDFVELNEMVLEINNFRIIYYLLMNHFVYEKSFHDFSHQMMNLIYHQLKNLVRWKGYLCFIINLNYFYNQMCSFGKKVKSDYFYILSKMLFLILFVFTNLEKFHLRNSFFV